MAGRRFTSSGTATGSRSRPPRKKPDNGLWIAVIVLFCLGLWPIALALLGYIWLTGDKNKRPEDKVRQAQQRMDNTIDEALRRVSQAGAEAEKAASQATQAETPHAAQTAAPGAGAASGPRVRQETPAKKPSKKSSKSIDKQIQKALGGDGNTLRIIGVVLIVLSTFILTEPIDDLIYLCCWAGGCTCAPLPGGAASISQPSASPTIWRLTSSPGGWAAPMTRRSGTWTR